jgi:phosphatidylglycerophosphate synthase
VFLLAEVLAIFALAFTFVLAGLSHHRPFACFGPANHTTLARAALVALLLGLLGEGDAATIGWVAAGVGLLAAALDGLDGWFARRSRMVSSFGERFDMETDAMLILALSALAWQVGKAGPWILLAGLMRYLFVGAGQILAWLRRPLPPSRRRQAVCVVQVLSLVFCIVPAVTTGWSHLVAAAGLVLLAWSFFIDVLWLAARARPPRKEVTL